MSARGAPDFADVEPGRRAWLYAILARAELAVGPPVRGGASGSSAAKLARPGSGLPYAEAAVLCARAPARRARAEPALRAPRSWRDSVGAVIQAGARAGRSPAALAADDETAIPLLERAESELGGFGAVRLRDEAARELRRRGVKTGARRRRATGGDGLAGLSPAASARSPTWSRSAAPTRRSRPSCSCPRRRSRAT